MLGNEWQQPVAVFTNGSDHSPPAPVRRTTMATVNDNGGVVLDWKLFLGGVLALFLAGGCIGLVFAEHLPFVTSDQMKPVTDNLANQIAQQGLAITQLRQQVTDDENKWYSLSEKLDDLRTDTKTGQAQIMQRLDDESRDRETEQIDHANGPIRRDRFNQGR